MATDVKSNGLEMAAGALRSANVGLTDEQRTGVARLLNRVLADQFLLYTKARNYHWNVVGEKFLTLHEFFQEIYESLDEQMDETAEFVRYFNAKSLGTMTEFVKESRLREAPGDYPKAMTMVENLLRDHETLIQGLREDIETAQEQFDAADVADYLTQQIEKHEKYAWMLRSLLE